MQFWGSITPKCVLIAPGLTRPVLCALSLLLAAESIKIIHSILTLGLDKALSGQRM